jgi:hypothetical protein
VAGRLPGKPQIMGEFFMMKKACLWIIGLVFLVTLCVPVAAVTGDQGCWSFNIVDKILGNSEVKINGHSTIPQDTYTVDFPNSRDRAEVQFVVKGGVTTTVTITKDYINKLWGEHPGWVPTVVAWGGPLTYDVDAGGQVRTSKGVDIMTHEHLVSRGWYHHGIGRIFFVELSCPLCFGVSALCSDP